MKLNAGMTPSETKAFVDTVFKTIDAQRSNITESSEPPPSYNWLLDMTLVGLGWMLGWGTVLVLHRYL